MNSHLDGQFSRYLANLMSEEERTSFEKELVENEELRNEFEEYQIGMMAGKRIQYLQLKDTVSKIIEEEDSKHRDSKIIKLSRSQLIRSAAAAVIVLCFIALGYIFISKKSGSEIYAQHIVSPSFKKVRGDNDNLVDIAINKFEEREFDSVLILINQMPDIERNQPYVQKLKGYTYTAQNDFDSAILSFKNATTEPESIDHLEAYWNIGNLYTRNEQYDSTLTYLNKIVDSKYKSDYKKSAKKLASEIKWQKFIQSWFGWLVN